MPQIERDFVPGLVSVMIPTYERPRMFEEALKSALAQTYPHVEIIVCDNSRDEDTAQLMQKYLVHPHVRYVRNREAKTKAENFRPFEGLARGEYLQWLMDDDVLRPEKLQYMVEVLQQDPTVTLVSSRRGKIDGEGNFCGMYPSRIDVQGRYGMIEGETLGRFMLMHVSNAIGEPSAVLFRSNDLLHHYWQAESRGYLAISDVAMWLELMAKGNCVIFRDSLSDYRVHEVQEGRQGNVVLLSRLEWFRLGTEYYRAGKFFRSRQDYEAMLKIMLAEYEAVHREDLQELYSCPLWPAYRESLETMKKMLALPHLDKVLRGDNA